eukprot:GHVN01059416.1.p4 GENE.GHVN01059416.1~~GHVN01059416.1.p4  ORF type:complete len:158 (+),score=16.79 GHVN01059416.1:2933-3406(+)
MSLATSIQREQMENSRAGNQERRLKTQHHEARVGGARPRIDNKPPESLQYVHIRNNAKRDAVLRERHQEIDSQNRRLLRRIAEIHLGQHCGRDIETQILRAQAQQKRGQGEALKTSKRKPSVPSEEENQINSTPTVPNDQDGLTAAYVESMTKLLTD